MPLVGFLAKRCSSAREGATGDAVITSASPRVTKVARRPRRAREEVGMRVTADYNGRVSSEELLRRHPLFVRLDSAQLVRFARAGELEAFRPGEDVVVEGTL